MPSATPEEAARLTGLFRFVEGLTAKAAATSLKDLPWVKDPLRIDATLPGVALWSAQAADPDMLLRVERQSVPPCPVPGIEISAWLLDGWKEAGWKPGCHETLPEIVPGTTKDKEKFADDPARVREYGIWLAQRTKWLADYMRAKASLELFNELYAQRALLADGSQQWELVAASALFAAREPIAGAEIRMPLLARRCLFEYQTQGYQPVIVVRLDPDAEATLTADPLQKLCEAGAAVNLEASKGAQDAIVQNGPHPFRLEDVAAIFKPFAAEISHDAQWFDSEDKAAFTEAVSYTVCHRPLLAVRRRPAGTRKAIEGICEYLAAGGQPPRHLLELVCGKPSCAQVRENAPETPEQEMAAVGGEDPDILLSKSANREQLRIARDIETQEAVIVQGPPGTGKTHTITNLAGHFLSQGKRILITSHTVKALDVLKEKLPADFQDLCVSLIGGTKDLQDTINALTQRVSEQNLPEARKAADAVRRERQAVIDELAAVRRELFAVRLAEGGSIAMAGQQVPLMQAAQWLRENAAQGALIAGSVADTDYPLTDQETGILRLAAEKLSASDIAALRDEALDSTKLPNPTEEEALGAEAHAAFDAIASLKARGYTQVAERGVCYISGPAFKAQCPQERLGELAALKADAEAAAALEAALAKEPALREAVLAGITGGVALDNWTWLADTTAQAAALASQYRDQSFRYPVEIAPDADLAALRKAAEFFRDEHPDGDVGFIGRLMHGEEDRLICGIRVDGKRPASKEAFEAAITRIRLEEVRSGLGRRWDALAAAAGLPPWASFGGEPETGAAAGPLPGISQAVRWWREAYGPIARKLADLGCQIELEPTGPGSADRLEAALASLRERIAPCAELADAHLRQQAFEERLEGIRSLLVEASGRGSAAAGRLLEALLRDHEAYRHEMAALEKAAASRGLFEQEDAILSRLEPLAPEWTQALRGRTAPLAASPAQLRAAWDWHRVESHFAASHATDYQALQRKAHELSARYRTLTESLASQLAWIRLGERLQSSLMMQNLRGWQSVMKRIGKGTGKAAAEMRANARAKMRECRDAVPAWIMTTQDAMLNFDAATRFDIIIIDEASQSDLSALAVLFMGAKVIVVGDDKQVSPMAIGTLQSTVKTLALQHLKDRVINWDMYSAETSLYDAVKTTYAPLQLYEHFRCVPDIIEFCSNLSYDGQIRPLRDASSTRLAPSLAAMRVPGWQRSNATNREEALAAVALIEAMVEQPEYKGKTIGVISMLSGSSGSSSQAGLITRLINETIDFREVEERRIACGNAYQFQGDERNVIIMTMVSGEENSTGQLRMLSEGRDESTKKRYNVAVSRAKDQLWIIHSFDPDSQLKEDDIRRTLFEHVRDPMAERRLREKATTAVSSPFEKAVGERLAAAGYRVQMLYRAGGYVLDMVVRSGRSMAAVECDGTEEHASAEQKRAEMARQTVLERSGWTFVYLRASAWQRDPDRAFDFLKAELARADVVPEAADAAPPAAPGDAVLVRARSLYAKLAAGEEIRPGAAVQAPSETAAPEPAKPARRRKSAKADAPAAPSPAAESAEPAEPAKPRRRAAKAAAPAPEPDAPAAQQPARTARRRTSAKN